MSAPLSEAEVRDLIGREEGQCLEFKSLWDRENAPPRVVERRRVRDMIAECVAAFANADGGTLVLGVGPDEGTPSGHGYPEEAITEFLAVPERRLRPAVRAPAQRIHVDGHELIVFQVGVSAEAVMVDGDGFPYRVGDAVVLEPQEVINERKQAYRRVGWEQRVRSEASVDDLNLDLARSLLARSVRKDRPVLEALESYGLILPQAGAHAVTNAALLLCARPPLARWHPRVGIRIFRVDSTQRQHGARRNVSEVARVELPIAVALPEAHRVVATQIRRSEKLHDLFFREMPEYPTVSG